MSAAKVVAAITNTVERVNCESVEASLADEMMSSSHSMSAKSYVNGCGAATNVLPPSTDKLTGTAVGAVMV